MALDGSGGSSSNNNVDRRNRAEIPQESLKEGPWTEEEDKILKEHVRAYGEGNWDSCQTLSGLMRCGESCRLRWVSNLSPDLQKGVLSAEEEAEIDHLLAKFGSEWSPIACQLPGRTDNEINNFWNHLPICPDDVITHQESNLPSPQQALNPTRPAFISIYDMFKTSSLRKATTFPGLSYEQNQNGDRQMQELPSAELFPPMTTQTAFGNNGLSYEQNGEAYRQMQELPSTELFAPMTTQTGFGNIGSSSYVPPTLNEVGVYADPTSSFSDAARSHLHASTAAALPSETNQVDDEFLSLLQTAELTMSMNDLFDKEGNILPDDEHMPSHDGW